MTAAQAKKVVDLLRAAFPRDVMQATSQAVYTRSLMEFTQAEAKRAVNVAVATHDRLPSVSAIRHLILEERLQLPEPMEAWEEANRWIALKLPAKRCIACAGYGYPVGAEDEICAGCNGEGEVRQEKPPLARPLKRALDFVGGNHAVRNATEPGIIRAQFLKAYESFRAAEIREANLVSLGVLEPAAERLSLVAGGEG
jgi:hypothetical protein